MKVSGYQDRDFGFYFKCYENPLEDSEQSVEAGRPVGRIL